MVARCNTTQKAGSEPREHTSIVLGYLEAIYPSPLGTTPQFSLEEPYLGHSQSM